MSRVLLDENIPVGLRKLLDGHDVFTVNYQGLKGLSNGRLLAAAKAARFDVFVTADQNLRFQQNIGGTSLAVVVLSTTDWAAVKNNADAIKLAMDCAEVGAITLVIVRIMDDWSARDR